MGAALQVGALSHSRIVQYQVFSPPSVEVRNCRPISQRLVIRACTSKKSTDAEAAAGEKWIKLLPDKKTALYSHSLPCIEAWLKSLGFSQKKDERSIWVIERSDWHAQLSLDITELHIRYMKSGPGKLERDVERKFSYALCREDLENAILGGP